MIYELTSQLNRRTYQATLWHLGT